MQYFKHSELAAQYHVSLKTVHNWISAAKNDKIALKLHSAKSGTYIANTAENEQTLMALAEKGKKYRNSLHSKTVSPREEFYELYTKRQILDIINNIEIHREIPGQYNYMGNGADNWDSWMKRLASDTSSNYLKGTIDIINNNLGSIGLATANGTRINVIDLGVGNAYPIRGLLRYFHERGVLNRYIGIDISPTMLDLAKENIKSWFGEDVRFEGYVRDMTYDRFDDLLVDDLLDDRAEQTINVFTLFGGTAANFRSYQGAIRSIGESLGRNDILLYDEKLDTEVSRKYFDFGTEKAADAEPSSSHLSEGDRYILDLLGIDQSLYEVESGYNSLKHMRYIQVRLKCAITIKFSFVQGSQHVSLEKGETIILLRILHHTTHEIIDTFSKAGLALIHANTSPDRQFYFSISSLEQK